MRIPAGFRPGAVVLLRPRGLGDVVLSSAVIDAVHRAWPGVALDYVAERPSGDLLRTDPRLRRIFLLGPRLDDGRVQGGGLPGAAAWLRAGRPDVAVDLFCNPRSALLTLLSGARYRVGLDREPRRLAYNVRVPRFHGGGARDDRYAGQVQLDILRDAGVRWDGEARPGVALTDADRRRASEVLREAGYADRARFGVLLPGGSWAAKRWTVAGFAEAGRELAARTGSPALVAWGPPERDDAAAIAEALGPAGRLAGPTTLREMAAVLARAAVVVAPDCLGRHLAVVQGVPTVGVFGDTSPGDWTPRSGPHVAVEAPGGDLSALAGEPVATALRSLLDEVDAPGARP